MKILCKLTHFLAGALTFIAALIGPGLAISATIIFLSYEFSQYLKRYDWPTAEILEFAFGFYFSVWLFGLIRSGFLGVII